MNQLQRLITSFLLSVSVAEHCPGKHKKAFESMRCKFLLANDTEYPLSIELLRVQIAKLYAIRPISSISRRVPLSLPEKTTAGSPFLSWRFCLNPIDIAPCIINVEGNMPRVQSADCSMSCVVTSCFSLSDISKLNLSGRAVLCLGNT